jgi:hypothetical protein
MTESARQLPAAVLAQVRAILDREARRILDLQINEASPGLPVPDSRKVRDAAAQQDSV